MIAEDDEEEKKKIKDNNHNYDGIRNFTHSHSD